MTDSEPRAVLFERLLPISLVLAILLIAFVTLYPFLPALLWGAMVAIAIDPAYKWLVFKLGGRRAMFKLRSAALYEC